MSWQAPAPIPALHQLAVRCCSPTGCMQASCSQPACLAPASWDVLHLTPVEVRHTALQHAWPGCPARLLPPPLHPGSLLAQCAAPPAAPTRSAAPARPLRGCAPNVCRPLEPRAALATPPFTRPLTASAASAWSRAAPRAPQTGDAPPTAARWAAGPALRGSGEHRHACVLGRTAGSGPHACLLPVGAIQL